MMAIPVPHHHHMLPLWWCSTPGTLWNVPYTKHFMNLWLKVTCSIKNWTLWCIYHLCRELVFIVHKKSVQEWTSFQECRLVLLSLQHSHIYA
jgi:hypothetical protein